MSIDKAVKVRNGNKIIYSVGERVGECYFVKEIDPKFEPSGSKVRWATFKCGRCGNEFEANLNSVKKKGTRSCGCLRDEKVAMINYKHGMADKHPLFKVWANIRRRCHQPSYENYHYYGGRGIRICKEWDESFQVFFDYVTTLPHYGEEGMTLDRTNNNGNYESGNVRWVDMKKQTANRRKFKSNTSGYTGVYFSRGAYVSVIRVHGKVIYTGNAKTKDAACANRNNYIIKHGLWDYPIQQCVMV